MKVIDRTKAETQDFLEKIRKTQKCSFSKCLLRHGVVRVLCRLRVSLCMGDFVMVPLNLIYLHCFQHSLFEHLFNLY